jgi:hypothetical protein
LFHVELGVGSLSLRRVVIVVAALNLVGDLIVGLGIAAMNAGAAREVWRAAREEHRQTSSSC